MLSSFSLFVDLLLCKNIFSFIFLFFLLFFPFPCQKKEVYLPTTKYFPSPSIFFRLPVQCFSRPTTENLRSLGRNQGSTRGPVYTIWSGFWLFSSPNSNQLCLAETGSLGNQNQTEKNCILVFLLFCKFYIAVYPEWLYELKSDCA